MNVSRRHLLQAGAAVAVLPAARLGATTITVAMPATVPRVAFLSPDQARDALAHGDAYYAGMGLQEIRARVGSALPGLSLADARAAARDFDAAAVLPFSDDARAALRGIAERLQPLLLSRAPLYARTEWSFIQLDDRAEGGMPHTRGRHIVLPKAAVEAWTKKHRDLLAAGKLAQASFGNSLLVHEQTHVLERFHGDRFEPLFTQVFGFTRLPAIPQSAWLAAHRCTNPDGPDVVWAFDLARVGGSGWILPDVVLPDGDTPRMPEDFESVAIELAPDADGGHRIVVDADGVPRRRPLDKVPGYDAWFPFPDEDFHPNEIAAVALSHWILRDMPDLDKRPLMPAIADWATAGLA